ncbi:hypothetical protein BX661DRAFT_173477 [Kickxella alabastrina]|uniref:uncharacterized protein n=1 Tax=Kickxella alabastrina TaxID=61397 RepID=UPI00222022A6|nr:uncharacterized protein BX661DRAFT_173477 [Kickxella alabastrina]KAI7820871.1 hypothetical protein BX661DRAFT_173477 [Kickxella alabastrina]
MTHVIISHGLVSVDIPISPDSQDIGKALVDSFAKSLCATSEPPLSAIELLARFIEFVSRDHSGTVFLPRLTLSLSDVFAMPGKQTTRHPDGITLFSEPTSESLTATIMMVFEGSIGFDNAGSVCLAELQRLVDVYEPLVLDFICQMSAFLYDESCDLQIAHCYPHGLAVAQWVSLSRAQSADVSGRKDVVPAAVYINSAPVAAPLVGLVQLVRLVVLYKTLNIPVEQVVKSLSAVAGHSHGIVVAVAVSMATNEAQLLAASQKALGTLMLAGCLPQMVCPQPYNEPLAATGTIALEYKNNHLLFFQSRARPDTLPKL